MLTWLQEGYGTGRRLDWVAYQILDLGAICRSWFHAEAILQVGPGALEWLCKVFPTLPVRQTGMCRDRRALQLAVPYQRCLSEIVRSSDEASGMRAVLRELGLPLPHGNVVEYWQCELRQARAAPLYAGMGHASAEYMAALSNSIWQRVSLAGNRHGESEAGDLALCQQAGDALCALDALFDWAPRDEGGI